VSAHQKEVQIMTASRKVTTAKASGRPPHKASGESATRRKITKQANARVMRTKRVAPAPSRSVAPARQSKKAAVIALLARPDGAAISDLIGVTGWQVHSVRAALTGLRKEGKDLVRAKDATGITHYRLASQA
jgi:Protein of unknown function (DUF3489)